MSAKILIIDHNDSFTYNLVQLLEQAGAECVTVWASDNIDFRAVVAYDGIVLSPGPALPKDYSASMELIGMFYKSKPLMGVCLGMQMIVEYFGGRLYNLRNVQHGRRVEIFTTGQRCPLLGNMVFPMKVGLYHSWAMDPQKQAGGLLVTSRTKDDVPMSLRHSRYSIFGVQFHPESYMTQGGLQLMKNWLDIVMTGDVFP